MNDIIKLLIRSFGHQSIELPESEPVNGNGCAKVPAKPPVVRSAWGEPSEFAQTLYPVSPDERKRSPNKGIR